MTKAERRVVIAKDVIKQIKARKYKPTQYVYVDSEEFDFQFFCYGIRDDDKQVKVPEKPCKVCAIGSCFLASVDRFDKLKISDLGNRYRGAHGGAEQIEHLQRWFSKSQLNQIEVAFEKGQYGTVPEWEGEKKWVDEAIKFGRQHRSARKRLLAIMKNIVKNKGAFKP